MRDGRSLLRPWLKREAVYSDLYCLHIYSDRRYALASSDARKSHRITHEIGPDVYVM